MNDTRAKQIISLTAHPGWAALAEEIRERMGVMDAAIHDPGTDHAMTNYFRGGYALGEDIINLGKQAATELSARANRGKRNEEDQ